MIQGMGFYHMPKFKADTHRMLTNLKNKNFDAFGRDLKGLLERLELVVNNLDNTNMSRNASLKHELIDFVGFDPKSIINDKKTSVSVNVTKKWRIPDKRLIPEEESYSTTGVVVSGSGKLTVEGKLVIAD